MSIPSKYKSHYVLLTEFSEMTDVDI